MSARAPESLDRLEGSTVPEPKRPIRLAAGCQIGVRLPGSSRLRGSSGIVVALVIGTLLGTVAGAAQDRRLELPGLDGSRLTEQQLQSGSYVLLFWASWSPRGRDIVARAQALDRQLGSRARVLLINFQEDENSVRAFLGGRSTPAVYLDREGDLAKRYSVHNLPGMLVLKDGEALYQDRLPADAEAVISRLLP